MSTSSWLTWFLFLGAPTPRYRSCGKSALPVRYVSDDDPPFLITHGAEDGTLPIEQIEPMQTALTRARVPVEFIIVEGGKHEMLNNGSIVQDVLQRMERFLTRVLKEDGN